MLGPHEENVPAAAAADDPTNASCAPSATSVPRRSARDKIGKDPKQFGNELYC